MSKSTVETTGNHYYLPQYSLPADCFNCTEELPRLCLTVSPLPSKVVIPRHTDNYILRCKSILFKVFYFLEIVNRHSILRKNCATVSQQASMVSWLIRFTESSSQATASGFSKSVRNIHLWSHMITPSYNQQFEFTVQIRFIIPVGFNINNPSSFIVFVSRLLRKIFSIGLPLASSSTSLSVRLSRHITQQP